VIFDDIAVGARVDGSDGRFDSGNAGNQQEEALRSDLLGEFEKVDTAFAGHAYVRYDDIENLGLELPPGGRNIMSYLDAMTFFPEGDFEQFANGPLVIHDENVHRVFA
jgi:hypothetical protein